GAHLYVARKFLGGMTRRIFQGGGFPLLVLRATMFVEELTGKGFAFESYWLFSSSTGCRGSVVLRASC
ncbi:hypothetical protein L195_g048754, partial [Trifolium pratense]